ncbi:hypothetical protein IMZ08_17295 [Bacillus luteolus]|uniref:Photosystem I assembly protein Ycf4 n=1 Tax=Litchfieldia luteola TaxID=682179 RepID=A0ABR9QMT6_9BACI|nr:hypothetical protein [Cytobacillus luteolus]MBE4909792.1 hypothetical protein [Cytobacillus luteolus]MBP1942665.1 hypothetical protein [Cytobacillus luteolus]
MGYKFKENSFSKIAGSIWLLIALANLGLMIYMITGLTRGFGLMMSPIYLFTILVSGAISIFHFRITKVDYVRMDDTSLSIFKSLALPRKHIKLSKIEQGRMIGSKLILILNNEKEVEINTKQLTIKEFEKLKVRLQDYFMIS